MRPSTILLSCAGMLSTATAYKLFTVDLYNDESCKDHVGVVEDDKPGCFNVPFGSCLPLDGTFGGWYLTAYYDEDCTGGGIGDKGDFGAGIVCVDNTVAIGKPQTFKSVKVYR